MKLSPKQENFRRTIQLLSVLAAGFGVVLFDPLEYLLPDMEHFLTRSYFAVPLLLFFCSVFARPLSVSAKRTLLLSSLAVLWFAAVQQQHQQLDMGTDSLSLFAVSYLMAFSFAAVADKKTKKAGMKWLGIIYIAGSLLLVLCAVMLLWNMVPEVLISRIYWDGTRLNALWHPNVGACLFMIGIGFTLYFLILTDRPGKKVLLALLAAILFCGMSLTNSRTVILLTCVLLGSSVFFVIYRGGLKRFVAGAAAALTIAAAVFLFSRALFDFHTQVQNAQPEIRTEEQVSQPVKQETHSQDETGRQEENAPPVTEKSSSSAPPADESRKEQRQTAQSTQGSFWEDFWTLNKRTYTWKAAIQAMRENPSLRLWGTKYVSAEISYRNNFKIAHAHNSWIQVMMELGIPGLLIALVYTGIALIRCAGLLLCRKADLDKKLLALMVLCIMVAGFLEPYLFVGGLSTAFANFLFFFLIGYLDHWCRELNAVK